MSGEKVIIANNNQPVVELVSLDRTTKKRTPGLLKGKIAVLEDWEKADKEIEGGSIGPPIFLQPFFVPLYIKTTFIIF